MLVLRRRRNCRNIAIALVADVTRAAERQRNASLQTPLAQTGVLQKSEMVGKRSPVSAIYRYGTEFFHALQDPAQRRFIGTLQRLCAAEAQNQIASFLVGILSLETGGMKRGRFGKP
jgi:hypothetical protein